MSKNMKKMTLTFELEKNNNWYVVLPFWPFAHRHLQMVAGADDLLDVLLKKYGEEGERRVTLTFYIGENFNGLEMTDNHLLYRCRKSSVSNGTFYDRLTPINDYPLKMWLCQVALFVCHKYPQAIAIDTASVTTK